MFQYAYLICIPHIILHLDSCSEPSEESCHTVEGKITLITHGHAGEAVPEAYARIRLAFLALSHDSQISDSVDIDYLGSNPFNARIDKLSKRADMGNTDNRPALFAVIFLITSALGSAFAIVALAVFLRTSYGVEESKSHREQSSLQNDKDGGVPSSICITISSSSDGVCELDAASTSDLDDSSTHDVGDEESADWCRFVYLQCSALTRVPEESSISTFK